MKTVVLLALVGLASCGTALIGGGQAKDFNIEYSYLDDQGREVEVEIKSPKLELDHSRPESDLLLRQASSIPDATSVRRVEVNTFTPEKAKPRFVQVTRKAEPIHTKFATVEVQPIHRPEVETRFVQLQAQPLPRVQTETRFVPIAPVTPHWPAPISHIVHVKPTVQEHESDAIQLIGADDSPKPEIRFVQVATASPEIRRSEEKTRFASFEVPKREVETQFVIARSPRRETETHFFQFEGPKHEVENQFAPKPEVLTRFIQQGKFTPLLRPMTSTRLVKDEHPVLVQAPRGLVFQDPQAVAPPTTHIQFAPPAAPFRFSSLGFNDHHGSSDDNSAEK
ncbi:hypothetical protein SK128_019079 [Halocaridina rubra]|uniref:Uncharacterized protein n=1 Tax=Halocaridina rubra TaxID=373956 RepID=A0AAN8WYS0_HALRR